EVNNIKGSMRAGVKIDTMSRYEFTIARLNEQVADTLFAFIPPADTKEVEELNSPFRPPKRANWTGRDALAFTLKDLDGNPTDFQGLKGKVVLLDFWASWCGPCVAELPHIEQIHRDFKDKGLTVLGINDEEVQVAREFVKQKNYTFTTLFDEGKAVARQYEVS